MSYYNKQTKPSNIFSFFFLKCTSIIQSNNKFNNVTICWLALLPEMSLQASERKQLSAHNFVDFYLQTTSTVIEMLRCRSPFRSLPSNPIRRTLTQMRCRTVAVHGSPSSVGADHPCCRRSHGSLRSFSLTGTIC